jgi:hypothetical protein
MCNIYPIWKMDHAQNLFFNWCYHSHGMHGSNLTKKNDFLHLWSLGRWVFKNLNFLLVVQTSVVDFPHDFATWLDCLHICSSSNCMEHFPFDLASLCYCTPSSSMFLCSSFFVRLVMLISLDICVFPLSNHVHVFPSFNCVHLLPFWLHNYFCCKNSHCYSCSWFLLCCKWWHSCSLC